MAEVKLGRVKKYDSDRGFGFIAQANGPDIFVHNTEIRMGGFRELHQDDIVSYSMAETRKGFVAKNVHVIKIDDSFKGKSNHLEFMLYNIGERSEKLMDEAANLMNDFGNFVEEHHGAEDAKKYYMAADQLVEAKERASKLEELDTSIDGLVAKVLEIFG